MKVHARTIVPFEVTGLLLGACTWGLMTLVVDMEHEVPMDGGFVCDFRPFKQGMCKGMSIILG